MDTLQKQYNLEIHAAKEKGDIAKITQAYLDRLIDFVKTNPKREDVPDAMRQIVFAYESQGKKVEAGAWRDRLSKEHPKTSIGTDQSCLKCHQTHETLFRRQNLDLTDIPRETLARRLSLDLTGLPPSVADVEAFAADKSPDYYEKYVERLMKSSSTIVSDEEIFRALPEKVPSKNARIQRELIGYHLDAPKTYPLVGARPTGACPFQMHC